MQCCSCPDCILTACYALLLQSRHACHAQAFAHARSAEYKMSLSWYCLQSPSYVDIGILSVICICNCLHCLDGRPFQKELAEKSLLTSLIMLSLHANSAKQYLLFVTTVVDVKKVVLVPNCPCWEIPLQSTCSYWLPNALSLHQESPCIECPHKVESLYL